MIALPTFGLTLHQPWAAHVVAGAKDIENRIWPPPPWILGKAIAVHAGMTWDVEGAAFIRQTLFELDQEVEQPRPSDQFCYARGAILGVATVTGVLPLFDDCGRAWHISDQFGWTLKDRRAFATPIPCRGFQKLWKLPADVLEQVRAAL